MAVETVPGRARVSNALLLTDATEQVVVAAPSAGSHLVCYGFLVANAGAAVSRFDVKEGTTAKFNFQLPVATPLWVPLPGGSHLPAATSLRVQQSAAQNGACSAVYEVIVGPG